MTHQEANLFIRQNQSAQIPISNVIRQLLHDSDPNFTGTREPYYPVRRSRERSIAITKLQEAFMWLEADITELAHIPKESSIASTETPPAQAG